MFLFIPILLTLCSLGLSASGYFIHLTDIHLDLEYKVGTTPDYRCREGTGPSGAYGYLGCNMPLLTVRESLAAIKKQFPSPDFIIYTGDASPHYVLATYHNEYTEAMVHENVQTALRLITEAYPGVPFYPIPGNHDVFPSDELSTDEAGMQLLSRMVDNLAPYLTSDQVATMKKGGYYAADLPDGKSRLLAVTTLWCDTMNFYALFSEGQRNCGMFNWLRDELSFTRLAGKKAMLIQHRPLGYSAFSPWVPQVMPHCQSEFLSIMREFSDVLTYGTFTGHCHDGSYRTVVDPASGQPVHTMWVMSSFNPHSDQYPGINVFYRDTAKGLITDLEVWYAQIDKSNEAGSIVIETLGSFKTKFGLSDMTPSALYGLYEDMLDGGMQDPTVLQYWDWAHNNAQIDEYDELAYAGMICTLGNIEHELYEQCMSALGI